MTDVANPDTVTVAELFKLAPAIARGFMKSAVRDIDEKFGEGYAAEHPELIGAFMGAATMIFRTVWPAANAEDDE